MRLPILTETYLEGDLRVPGMLVGDSGSVTWKNMVRSKSLNVLVLGCGFFFQTVFIPCSCNSQKDFLTFSVCAIFILKMPHTSPASCIPAEEIIWVKGLKDLRSAAEKSIMDIKRTRG
ncbi:UNVERIFIED_CONTAM: hypothetical protein K2H54_059151 [Gekko kuhli]